MSNRPPLTFKRASEDWEFEQIHRLNYRTFVEEIPQHQASPSHRLVDKFHAENAYLVCLCENTLAGMLAVRGARPFSLDAKVENLGSHLPPGRKICEVRLLAVDKKFRGAQVLQGLLALLWQHGVEMGYDLAIISGTTRQFKLYHHLGFIPFGPLVGTGEAQFQPMYITLETFEKTARDFLRSSPSRSVQASAVNFLPGPVTVRREVRRAFEQAPESHRGDSFMRDFQQVKRALCELTGASRIELFMGSGTLANDIVAAQISQSNTHGLILSNGEFGERLIDHGRRQRLDFALAEFGWGEPFDLRVIRGKLIQEPRPRWMWFAHCETSTGILNDLASLKTLCAEFDVRLCADCISSVGTVPVDVSELHLASCASGKGLRSYPGVSMVLYNQSIEPSPVLPRYLDLGNYAANEGLPFTFSSNLLQALHAAIKRVVWNQRFIEFRAAADWLRPRLRELGFTLVGADSVCSPAVVTIALPSGLNSTEIGARLAEAGYLLSCNSGYLRRRNWIQVCTMGECGHAKLLAMTNALARACSMTKAAEPAPIGA